MLCNFLQAVRYSDKQNADPIYIWNSIGNYSAACRMSRKTIFQEGKSY